MNMITTAMMSTPTAAEPDARAVTSQIVNLYRSGQSQQAEDYAVWAWGNHFHITVKMFADEWASVVEAPVQNPAIAESNEVADGKGKAFEAHFLRFMETEARAYFGEHVEHWRGIAQALEQMSEDARSKRFDLLITGERTTDDLFDLYGRVYKSITPIFMAYFAPRAMTPDDFIRACVCERVRGQMPRMTCPACDSSEFYESEAEELLITSDDLRVSLLCADCGFPLEAVIEFT